MIYFRLFWCILEGSTISCACTLASFSSANVVRSWLLSYYGNSQEAQKEDCYSECTSSIFWRCLRRDAGITDFEYGGVHEKNRNIIRIIHWILSGYNCSSSSFSLISG